MRGRGPPPRGSCGPGRGAVPAPLAGGQKASLTGLSPQRPRQPQSAPRLGAFSVWLVRRREAPPPHAGALPRRRHVRHMGALGGALPRDSVPPAFDGPASLCPAAEAGVGREATVRAPPATCHSAVSPGFHGYPAFLRGHFPPESAPSYPSIRLSTVNSSPHPDGSTVPQLQLAADAPSKESMSLSGVCMAAARTV